VFLEFLELGNNGQPAGWFQQSGWAYSGDALAVHVYTNEAAKVQVLVDLPVAVTMMTNDPVPVTIVGSSEPFI